MSDNLDKELTEWVNSSDTRSTQRSKEKEKAVESTKTSPGAAAFRGAMSGLTSGWAPEIAAGLSTGFGMLGDYEKSKAESEAAQEKAYQDQPGMYRAGYGPAAVGSLLIGPGIALKALSGAGKVATKAAPLLNKAFGEAVEQVVPVAGKAAGEFAQGVASGAGQAIKESPQFAKVMNYIKGAPNISGVPTLPQGARMTAPAQVGSAVGNYLTSADAERVGEGYAEGGLVELGADEKRRQAMQMQSTPQGRAQTNTDV